MRGWIHLYSGINVMPSFPVLISTCGHPIVPRKGDAVFDGERRYIVDDVVWDLVAQTVTVSAQAERMNE